MASYKKLSSKCNNLVYKSTIANCCFRAFSVAPTRKEKPWQRGLGYPNPNPILVINYHVHMIPFQRVKIWVLLERCLEFWLVYLLKKRGLFSVLVQNSPKVTKKVLVFRKVARSCSLTKKLLKILKVAKTLPSRIWKGLISRQLFRRSCFIMLRR